MSIFVGRERELQMLDESLDDAISALGKLALVSGEPGIGKTRLAEELTQRAERRGFGVAWGRSWEGEGTPAYFPWRQALRRLAPSFPSVFEAARADHPELGVLFDAHQERSAPRSDPAEA